MLDHPSQQPSTDPQAAWRLILDRLRGRVDETTLDLWLHPLQALDCADGTLLLAGEPHLVRWARDRCTPLLTEVAQSAGIAQTIAWIEASPADLSSAAPTWHAGDRAPAGGAYAPATTQGAQSGQGNGHTNGHANGTGDPAPAAPLEVGDPIDPTLTFESFVIGHSNRLAHGAALQVAELPAAAFNPLLLCGPPGTGKTHLMHAIANYVDVTAPHLRVHLCTSERFVSDFLGALRSRRIGDFKDQVRGVDVLLVDDIQFLAGKDKTEEEFFHTFNALERSGAQLVLTSDQPPGELGDLSERLRARFASGLVVDLERPDDALRRTYVARRAAEELDAPQERAQLSHLAEKITDGLRTLEGAILSTIAYRTLTGRELDQALVDDVVRRLYPQSKGRAPERPTIRRVQDVVCAEFDLDHETLVGPSRAAAIAWPRQVAMYLARQHTEASLPTIARAFNRRDHTTVMHAVSRVTEQIDRDPTVHTQVSGLVDNLR
ncbi:MAG: chromosomal replication initiator protein DnaA [Solirubrobacteraceae bacterium]|nr:chromosomal replication initiator protein DnaA [Solirubrobacteraceae bacterium]